MKNFKNIQTIKASILTRATKKCRRKNIAKWECRSGCGWCLKKKIKRI